MSSRKPARECSITLLVWVSNSGSNPRPSLFRIHQPSQHISNCAVQGVKVNARSAEILGWAYGNEYKRNNRRYRSPRTRLAWTRPYSTARTGQPCWINCSAFRKSGTLGLRGAQQCLFSLKNCPFSTLPPRMYTQSTYTNKRLTRSRNRTSCSHSGVTHVLTATHQFLWRHCRMGLEHVMEKQHTGNWSVYPLIVSYRVHTYERVEGR